MAHILLIEPDRLLADVYRQALEQAGHQVRSAVTAQSAISVADELTPEAIILELQLVEHSGFEFLYELRSYPEWQAIPVVVLSHVPPAEFTASKQLLTHELGVRAYHYKPLTSLHSLVRSLDECLKTLA